MDLTRRTLLGLVKYPTIITKNPHYNSKLRHERFIKAEHWKPIKGLFTDDTIAIDWMLSGLSAADRERFTQATTFQSDNFAFLAQRSLYKSLDCSIMEIADDVAYGVHDLEDAIALNKVSRLYWDEEVLPGFLTSDNPWAMKHAKHLTDMLFSREHHQRKNAIGALVNHLITNIQLFEVKADFAEPLLRINAELSPPSKTILELLKRFVYKHVIQDTELQQNEFRGQRMLMALFEAFTCDPLRLLPKDVQHLYSHAITSSESANRIVCDYLATMSDEHADRIYQRVFGN